MEGFFSIVGMFLGGLLVVAVAVAAWEHLRDRAGAAAPPSPAPSGPVRVDFDVEALAAPAGDGDERQRALQGALNRAAGEGVAWVETTPCVAPGTLAPTRESAGQPR